MEEVEHPMQMVPLLMREDNKESDDWISEFNQIGRGIVFNRNDDYDPKVVSLGPYHHGKKKLKFVEDYKPKAVKMFIDGGPKIEDEYLNAILENIGYVRSCYLEEFMPSMYTDEDFAIMMLRDACIILSYINVRKEPFKKDAMIKHLGTAVYNSIIRDTYLLENQVPFGILEILVGLRYGTDRHAFVKEMETTFFKRFFHVEEETELEEARGNNIHIDMLGTEPLHLLEIFRKAIVTGHDRDPGSKPGEHRCNINNLVWHLEKSCCCHDDIPVRSEHVFRSVTDLKSKGMDFSASRIKSLRGVRFRPYELCKSAELKLPLLYVTKDTRVFFKNLIAYEFSPYVPNPSDKAVTAYVNFMRLLVISNQDVKELREKQIIINGLGRDEEVVEMYKALDTFGAEDTSFLWGVKMDIEEHYHSKAKTWIADLWTTYLNSPWSTIALFIATFLLCLDIVQTYYAVNPKDSNNGTGGGSAGAHH
ncbi:UPF0481 protein At3g47200-like [Lycium barbarum]|uniref:UPF0481 protein At3g47200-like n=1 Tax=Lycium barbarum TaxID=112863 RepID=UPI00293EA342|nr:UPF0481 protein At3g47200-like [Lycium barbarum]